MKKRSKKKEKPEIENKTTSIIIVLLIALATLVGLLLTDNYIKKIYNKPDLTIKWLDENCECFCYNDCNVGIFNWKCGNLDYYIVTAKNIQPDSNCILKESILTSKDKCSKYSCGDFQVEVKR